MVSLLSVIAGSETQAASYVLAIIPMAILAGVILCAMSMRRRHTSAVCVCSLTLFLIGIFILTAMSVGAVIFHWARVAGTIAAALTLIFFAGSFIVGVIGLAIYDRRRFARGRAYAIWALSLCAACIAACVVAAAVGAGKRVAAQNAIAPSRVVLSRYNCAVTAPAGWASIDPKTLGLEVAPVAYRRTFPEMYMVMLPEESGDIMSHAGYMKLLEGREDAFGEVKERSSDVVNFGRMSFRRLMSVTRSKKMNLDIYREHLVAKHGAMFWQLVVWGSPRSRAEIQAEAVKFAEHFQILDPNLMGSFNGNVRDVSLPRLGFSTHLEGTGWDEEDKIKNLKTNELIAFSAHRVSEALMVIPLRFEDPAPDFEALSRGMLSSMGFERPLPEDTKPFVSASGEGIEFTTEREMKGVQYSYILRFARGEHHGHLVIGLAAKEGGNLEVVRRALDKIELRPPEGSAPFLSPGQRRALTLVLNQAAMSLYNRRDFDSAAFWFRQAYQQTREDPVSLNNLVTALDSAGRTKEALEILDSQAWRFPKAAQLEAHRLKLLVHNGDADAANEQFLKLIEKGAKDEMVLQGWLDELLAQNRQDLAEKTLDAWMAKQPSVKVSEWQASIYMEEGDAKRAEKLMEKVVAENPGDDSVLTKFGETLNMAKEYKRAGDIADKLLADGKESSRALQILGWSQMGRKSYREAKGAFERAARLQPEDTQLQTAVRLASAEIGQGNNSDVNLAVEPVPMPPEIARELESAEAHPPKVDGEAAVVLARSVGYAFEAGKPLRTTIRRKIRVLDQAGVTACSTLEFPYDPVAERIFVNRLVVMDPSGKVSANGSLDDAFVRDSENAAASNLKMLQVQVPGLKPGSVIDAEVTLEDRSTQADFPFTRHLFAYGIPCAGEAIFVTGDISRVKAFTAQAHDIKAVKKDRLLGWIVRDRAATHEEALGVLAEKSSPILWLGAGNAEWNGVAKEYLGQIADRLQPDAAATKEATEICKGLKDPREKIEALARVVQKEVSYKALEFGVRARRPNAACDTLRQRFGDCKDHALLLYQLLRGAGVQSYLALVNTQRRIQPSLPSIDQFNHMVVYVPSLGNGWLVDATDKYLAEGLFPGDGLWESAALVLDPAKPRLIPPQVPPEKDCADVESHRTISAEGRNWKVNETLTLTGYYASSMRAVFAGLPPAEQTRRAQSILAGEGAAEVKEFRFENIDDLPQPARISMSYIVRNAIKTNAGKATAALPALWERDYLAQTFVPDRATPFLFRFPFHFSSDVSVKGPVSVRLGGLTKREAGKFADWEIGAGAPSGTGSTVHFEFRAHPGEYPAGQYAGFYETWDDARRAWDTEIEWGPN
jgi:tetratricopeptide (TPR) repeat protein